MILIDLNNQLIISFGGLSQKKQFVHVCSRVVIIGAM